MLKINNKEITARWVLFIIILGGAVFRLIGFDKYGFNSADEYYIIKSVKNILSFGLPEFPSGGYYIRGILYQYLSAGLILIGVKDVTALRIIPIICSLLSIPLIYLIARKVTNISFALFAVFLFTFSVWEIEISRLARFYAPFQLVFLSYIYLLIQVIVDKKFTNYKWLYLLSITGLLVHEEGIFLVILNFLPLYLHKHKPGIVYSSLIFLLGLFLTLFSFRNTGVINRLPSDIILEKGSSSLPIYNPNLLILKIASDPIWLVALLVPVLAFIFYNRYFLKAEYQSLETRFYFLVFGILILLNLFSVALFLLVILLFSKKIKSENLKIPDVFRFSAFLIITFIFYAVYCLTNHWWLELFHEKSFSFTRLMLFLINYPDFYGKFFMAWFKPFPFLTLFILSSFAFIIFLFLKKFFSKKMSELNEYLNALMLVVLILFFLISIIVTPFKNLRYWFLLYPLFLVFITFMIFRSKLFFKSTRIWNIAVPLFLILFFFISEDHNLSHLGNISSWEVSFRKNLPGKLAETYYFKEDYESAAIKIKENMLDDDLIITTVAPVEYYLPKLDYYYRTYKDPEFSIRSRNKGKTEVWTNSKLIYKEEEFINLIEKRKNNIWLVTYSETRPGVPDFDKELIKKYSGNPYFSNLDGSLKVFYIKSQTN